MEAEKVDPKMDPDASPDLLAPSKGNGPGVRRINKLPLVIVGGLVVVAVLAITYTYYQRQEAQQVKPQQEQALQKIEEAAVPTVRPESSGRADGYIPPADPLAALPTDDTDVDGMPVAPQGGLQEIPALSDPLTDQPATAGAQGPVMSEAESAELEERRQLIKRIEESKLTDWERALEEGSSVDGATRAAAGSATAGNAAAVGGVGTDVGGGLSAQDQALAALSGIALPGQANPDPNGQSAKRKFLDTAPSLDNYLAQTRTAAMSQFEVKAGTVIPSVMISGLNSDLPGQVIGQVRENVYDSSTGRHLLIPRGARLIGTYDNGVTMGQRRALTAWTRIIYPDGSSVNLGMMPGADRAGYAGFRDKVNNHYGRIYGNAFLLSVFSAGIQLSQPAAPAGPNGTYDTQQVASAELGRQLGQLGVEQARRNLDIAPTIEIRNGYKFNVMVTKDMVLPPYHGK